MDIVLANPAVAISPLNIDIADFVEEDDEVGGSVLLSRSLAFFQL